MNRKTQNIIAAIGIASTLIFGGAAIISNSNTNKQPSPTYSDQNNSKPSTIIQESETEKLKEPKVETKTETSTRAIPYETKYVNDSSLPKGQTKTTTAGVNGTETTTYEVTYTDGVETSRKVISVETTKQPTTEVIAQGTYVAPQPQTQTTTCPNGTYVNSAGNTVCRPAASSSRPAGATAQCKDGTYSYSQNRRGTCSHHGGVKAWF